MKYLKKYNLITEENKLDLDIETFKELMYDVTDIYDYDVNYHSSSTGENIFVTIEYNSDGVDLDFNLQKFDKNTYFFERDSYLSSSDSYDEFHKEYSKKGYKNIEKLNHLLENVNSLREKYENCIKINEYIQNHLLKKLKYYNLRTLSVHIDEDKIRIHVEK